MKKKQILVTTATMMILSISLTACSSGSESGKNSSSQNAKVSGHVTAASEKTNETASKDKKEVKKKNTDTLEIGDNSVKILKQKSDKVDFSDNSWPLADIAINNIKILKVEPFVTNEESGTKAEGIIVLHVSIKGNGDIKAYPEQGTLITSDGQQVEGDYIHAKGYKIGWDGSIAKGVKTEGDIIFPLEKLDNINNIKSLRLKFDGWSDSDDDNRKDYDITMDYK